MTEECEMLPGYKSQSGFSYVYEKYGGEQELIVVFSCNQGGYVGWVVVQAEVDDTVTVVSTGYEKYRIGFEVINDTISTFLYGPS